VSVAVGIVTYNRPRFADKCIRAAENVLAPLSVPLVLANDCSDEKYAAEYKRAYKRSERMTVIESPENRGVASAKNLALRYMLESTDADWLFLLEDDILLQDAAAVTEYVRIAEETGQHHLSFAHHGPANAQGPVDVNGELAYFPHSIGAWCLYSRESLETVGLFDENFHNAWEHVEHELRLIHAGFMPGAGPHRFPDAANSELWLSEIPSSIEKSSIRPRSDWNSSIVEGLRYWKTAYPETFELMFGPGTQLEGYANGILFG